MRSVPLLWAISVPLLFVLLIAGVFHPSPSSDTMCFRLRFLCAWLTRSLDLRDCFTTIWVLKEPEFSCYLFLPHRSGQLCWPRICSTPSCLSS